MPRSARRLYDALTLGRAGPAWPRACWVRAPARPRPRTAWAQRAARAARWCGWAAGRAAAGALVRTRVLAAEAAAPAAPEPWCAAVVAGARAALADILTEAGDRGVILGGAGAGAALAAALASTPRVRALLLLAPPLLTLAGERDTPDDPLAEIRLPMLVVAGTGAAQCWRGAARELTRGEAGARRLLELRGADDALRLPAALRRRLPQHALDAAVAVSCAAASDPLCATRSSLTFILSTGRVRALDDRNSRKLERRVAAAGARAAARRLARAQPTRRARARAVLRRHRRRRGRLRSPAQRRRRQAGG
ncbi:unnamed protein product [Chrysodeixis includens]|uniref:Uncharacterized protein n=1 Tax=Chrysodeixis includens TaxID=689277 RepID=A0A9P0C4H7_CHRIL|nr:unnamed protein product [Chrysodeixis includens]